MEIKSEWKFLGIGGLLFFAFYFLPIDQARLGGAFVEAIALTQNYVREHIILCLLPALFIAGAITIFIRKDLVMKYLGTDTNKLVSYGVASVSGVILAVCSCTVLPLFAGIYKRGAGLGPAIAFLYSGPAINILAIILTARILGTELGIARAIGAILFSVVLGLIMQSLFGNDQVDAVKSAQASWEEGENLSIKQIVIFFSVMMAILIFANWSNASNSSGIWATIYNFKWIVTAVFGTVLGVLLIKWFHLVTKKVLAVMIITAIIAIVFSNIPVLSFSVAIIGLSYLLSTGGEDTKEWFLESYEFAKQILPLLFWGVLIAGFLLGRPQHEGMIPSHWIASAVGGNSFGASFFASLAGAFMYFATLTEIPIIQGLIGNGMGKGAALALLLAGPAVSLPNMLVIKTILGTKKTAVYVLLVIVISSLTGFIYGKFF